MRIVIVVITNIISFILSVISAGLSVILFAPGFGSSDSHESGWLSFIFIAGFLAPAITCFIFRKKLGYFVYGVTLAYAFYAYHLLLAYMMKTSLGY